MTLNLKLPFLFIVPPIIFEPFDLRTGIDSPVIIDSSMLECPSIRIPSAGILFPGLIIMTSSKVSSEIFTSISLLSFRIVAVFGLRPINSLIEFLVFFLALLSNNLPRRIRVTITAAVSKYTC